MPLAAAVKLSPAIKQLIALPKARGSNIASPGQPVLNNLFSGIAKRGENGGIKRETWLTLLTAGVMTVNSPQSLCGLYDFASGSDKIEGKVKVAAIMREAGLKCISFNGIPRTINGLGALRGHLPIEVTDQLDTTSHRDYTSQNIETSLKRGRALWDDIYEPHSLKLLSKLSDSHPDLPVHILTSHYSNLLSDPFTQNPSGGAKIGRILTSVIAITCLRAQGGVGPQVTSHVFGLKKGLLPEGGATAESEVEGQEWLGSDEGLKWILESTDEIAEVTVGRGETSFAGPIRESKL